MNVGNIVNFTTMTVVVGTIVTAAVAQDRTAGNPRSGDPAAVRAGTMLFQEPLVLPDRFADLGGPRR